MQMTPANYFRTTHSTHPFQRQGNQLSQSPHLSLQLPHLETRVQGSIVVQILVGGTSIHVSCPLSITQKVHRHRNQTHEMFFAIQMCFYQRLILILDVKSWPGSHSLDFSQCAKPILSSTVALLTVLQILPKWEKCPFCYDLSII